jgi:flagellar motility protein MotE (MotC chaperone)
MIRLLQAPITSMTLGGLSFLLTMFLLLKNPLPSAAKTSHGEDQDESVLKSFWDRHNPEIDQLLQEVRQEKEALAKREAELRELATRLAAERAEINSVTQRVAQLQMEFDQSVIRIKEDEVPNLKRLAKLYTTMSSEAVLTILKELDDQTVVKLFNSMKDSDTAPLLEAMAKEGDAQAKRAAALSESLRRTITEKKKGP